MASISVSYTDGYPKRPTTALSIVSPLLFVEAETRVAAITVVTTNPPIIDRQGVVSASGAGTGSQTYWVTG